MNLAEKYPVTQNEGEERFEVALGDELAYLDYRWYQDKLVLLYIFVPVPYRGKGVSNVLIQHTLEFAKSKNVKINIYCPYIARYVRTHAQYEELVDRQA